jgi:hypothetical protein
MSRADEGLLERAGDSEANCVISSAPEDMVTMLFATSKPCPRSEETRVGLCCAKGQEMLMDRSGITGSRGLGLFEV